MTAAEIEQETERLREGVTRVTAAIRALGVTPQLRQTLETLRRDFVEARVRMLEERTVTLHAGLPPPRLGFALRPIALHLTFLESSLQNFDSLLQAKAA